MLEFFASQSIPKSKNENPLMYASRSNESYRVDAKIEIQGAPYQRDAISKEPGCVEIFAKCYQSFWRQKPSQYDLAQLRAAEAFHRKDGRLVSDMLRGQFDEMLVPYPPNLTGGVILVFGKPKFSFLANNVKDLGNVSSCVQCIVLK